MFWERGVQWRAENDYKRGQVDVLENNTDRGDKMTVQVK